ncbi:HlyD family secretion protein [Phyllobacterium sp. CL33Tsu]|uniref:efflux RND transporter periplasmic adaptor subunit n=1 Tax=Phyllobacterium sp. CL33Tsu TaxID=1798191 RepID=UPI0008EA73EA|nr:HlyD family efflux transporter periplasmic adaptor subunit [Phyllobacterium sp. CL33Tsu]SFJ17347.1 HlyD family secretion protein [Phyllobacterium sp. CL33Tsu]
MTIQAAPKTVVRIGGGAGAPTAAPIVSNNPNTPVAQVPQDDAVAALRHLLRVEGEIRACRSVDELSVLLVNEIRKMTEARIAYFLDIRSGDPRIIKVSGASEIDRNAPAIRWLQKELKTHPPPLGWEKMSPLTLRSGSAAEEHEARTFPFAQAYWLPLSYPNVKPASGVLVVGEQPFQEGQIAIGDRIAGTAAHAATVLVHKVPRHKMRPHLRGLFYLLSIAAIATMFYPVPMTALAPMEVVPQDPFVVAAPIDGVIDNIVAAPNSMVKTGDVVVQYVDTVPRNQLRIAEEEVSVAVAKLRQLQQSSFVDESAKRELAQSRAELKLKIAERDFAQDTFEKSQIRAARDGIVVYADRKEWVGKPVVTGQRILEIADVNKVELRANLPVAEVLNLKPGAPVRAFLDGDPLNPLEATVSSTSQQARMVEGQGLVYRIDGQFDSGRPLPRPGVRGTAQLFSDKAPLGYYLFRRPLTWLRQKVGL